MEIRSNARFCTESCWGPKRRLRVRRSDVCRPKELTAASKRALDGCMSTDESSERFATALGLAALDLWGELPQEVQQLLFEQAVVRGHKTERDESLREQLAQFLHDHHERTAKRNAGQAGAV